MTFQPPSDADAMGPQPKASKGKGAKATAEEKAAAKSEGDAKKLKAEARAQAKAKAREQAQIDAKRAAQDRNVSAKLAKDAKAHDKARATLQAQQRREAKRARAKAKADAKAAARARAKGPKPAAAPVMELAPIALPSAPAPVEAKGKLAALLPKLPPIGVHLGAGALALAAISLALAAGGFTVGVIFVPWAAFLLALAAAMPAKPGLAQAPEASRVRLSALAIAAFAMLLILALVQGMAAMAAVGALFSAPDIASIFIQGYPAVLGVLVVAGGMGRIGAARWSEVLPVPPARRLAALMLAAATGMVAAIVSIAALSNAEDLLSLRADRVAFVGALAVMGAIGAWWAGCLPSVPLMADWLGRRSLRESRVARQLSNALGLGAIVASVGGLAAWTLVGSAIGVPVLALGLLLAMGAGFPSGVARFVPPMGLFEDPQVTLLRRKPVLRALMGMSALAFALGGLGLLLGLWNPSEADYDASFVSLARDAMAGVLVLATSLQAGLALLGPRFPVPGILPERRRAIAWDCSLFAMLLTVFGIVLGSGLASGPGTGAVNGAVLLIGASLLNGIHLLLRVVLVPPLMAKQPGRAKEEKVKLHEERDAKEHVVRTMHLAYAAGLGITALLVALIMATSLGVVDIQQGVGLPAPALFLLLIVAAMPIGGYIAWRYLQARSVEVDVKKAATLYKKRLTSADVSRLSIISSSVSLAVVFTVFGFLTQFGILTSLGPFNLQPKFSTDFFVFAILVGLGPYGFMLAREQSRMRAVDQKFPEFLRDLAESKRAGMTLTQAVITGAKGNYGVLTPEIQKMAAQIEWGISFSDALERFALRVKTPLIGRSVSLIVQAQAAGGNVVDILHAAAEDAREIQMLLRERKTAMSIYVMIIYIAFFVFLSVVAILDAQFLPEVAKAVGGAHGITVGPIKFGKVDQAAFEQVFFHAAIIQAMGGGFVAGVMEEGKPIAGLRHAFIMVIFGYISFRFFIGG